MENVFVDAIRLGREIVPHETLDRMIVGLDRCILVRLRDEGREDFKSKDVVSLVFRGVAPLDREPQQTFLVGIFGINTERDGIDAAYSEDGVPLNRLRSKPHDRLLPITRCACWVAGPNR